MTKNYLFMIAIIAMKTWWKCLQVNINICIYLYLYILYTWNTTNELNDEIFMFTISIIVEKSELFQNAVQGLFHRGEVFSRLYFKLFQKQENKNTALWSVEIKCVQHNKE